MGIRLSRVFEKMKKKMLKFFFGLNDVKINSKTKMSSDIFLFKAILADFLPLFKKKKFIQKSSFFSFFFCFQHQHWQKWTLNPFNQLILHVQTVLIPFIGFLSPQVL